MSYDTQLYYVISLLGGIIHKIYDDLYDNDLYETFGIKNKIFVNELLKSLMIICFTIISLKNAYLFILFFSVNIILYLAKKDDFEEYEMSSMISILILIPFLNYQNLFKNINDLYFLILGYVFVIILEIKTGVIEDEYSLKKLIQRLYFTFSLIILLFFNFYTNYSYLSSDINYSIIVMIGYSLTSSLFQAFLLYKNSKNILSSSILHIDSLTIYENKLFNYFYSVPIFSYFLDLNPLI